MYISSILFVSCGLFINFALKKNEKSLTHLFIFFFLFTFWVFSRYLGFEPCLSYCLFCNMIEENDF